MHSIFPSAFLAATRLCAATCALAGERGTPDEAVALVQRAEACVQANGRHKALAEFSNPQGGFKDRACLRWSTTARARTRPTAPTPG